MYILGISCFYHDSAAVLLKDGVIIAASEEERFSRIKHDASFPQKAIDFCLSYAGITSEDLDYVVFYEKPFVKFERIFRSTIASAPQSLGFFRESLKEWFFDKLWIKSHIIKHLNIPPNKLLFCEHHLSHAASSFFCSPFEKSAVLTIDGVGEQTTTAWGIGDDRTIKLKEELQFPQSLGLLYSTFTVFCGFQANEGEYKVMGLAPYGKPKYIEKIYQLLDVKPDGSFRIDTGFVSYHYSLTRIFTKKFTDLFGEPKKPGDEVVEYYADIAASIQYVLEEILMRIGNYVHDKTGLDNLCYAGGVALNSAANWKILKKTPFKQLFIQPAAGDSGGALGAALWAYHTVLKQKRTFVFSHAYLGAEESNGEIKQFLSENNITFRRVKNTDDLCEIIAKKLMKKKVIGWVQGRFEWGPRALGHRSILADPRDGAMKELVNSKIKFREGFRPFAPSVISEKAADYFVLSKYSTQIPLSYMLFVTEVKKERQTSLGAVTHVDGTARPQVVKKEQEPLYHKLITTFGELSGVPVILNTSFNLKGEPIVNTAREAYETFMRSGIDTLVLHDYIIDKHS